LAYDFARVIIETSIFTCQIVALMNDDDYALKALRGLVEKEFGDGR